MRFESRLHIGKAEPLEGISASDIYPTSPHIGDGLCCRHGVGRARILRVILGRNNMKLLL
jgi:hypothetical protein